MSYSDESNMLKYRPPWDKWATSMDLFEVARNGGPPQGFAGFDTVVIVGTLDPPFKATQRKLSEDGFRMVADNGMTSVYRR